MTTPNPVGLPHPNPTKSYWQTPPLPISDHRSSLNLPHKSKYVVIGSGITGASIAYKLLDSGHATGSDILMLEAGQTCSRDSGRNGGHCRPGDYRHLQSNIDWYGVDEAKKIWRLEVDSIKGMTDEIEKLGIDCDLQSVETMDASCDEPSWKQSREALHAHKEHFGKDERYGIHATVYTAEDVGEQLLMPKMQGAVTLPAFTVHPYKMVCGFLDICLKQGMNLQTNTPVVAVERKHDAWDVITERGIVRAEQVIMATNAYTGALYAPLANIIKPMRGQAAAIRPGSKIAGNEVLKRSIVPMRKDGEDYFITRAKGCTGEGDIIYGGNWITPSDDDSIVEPDLCEYLEHAAQHIFTKDNWGEVGQALQHWSGILGITTDEHPIIGQIPVAKGLYFCGAYNGHGMALSWRCANALVDIIFGRSVEWLPHCYKIERFALD